MRSFRDWWEDITMMLVASLIGWAVLVLIGFCYFKLDKRKPPCLTCFHLPPPAGRLFALRKIRSALRPGAPPLTWIMVVI